jgi:hypothetical protein
MLPGSFFLSSSQVGAFLDQEHREDLQQLVHSLSQQLPNILVRKQAYTELQSHLWMHLDYHLHHWLLLVESILNQMFVVSNTRKR